MALIRQLVGHREGFGELLQDWLKPDDEKGFFGNLQLFVIRKGDSWDYDYDYDYDEELE